MDTPELKPSTLEETDNYMPNAYPRRKMFSSIKVGDQQHTDDQKDGTMRTVKGMLKAIKADGELVTPEK